jgi:hypothetical protein
MRLSGDIPVKALYTCNFPIWFIIDIGVDGSVDFTKNNQEGCYYDFLQ